MISEGAFRRRTVLTPRGRSIRAEVEDDFHHFWVELDHDGAAIERIRSGAVRFPWSTCPAAGIHLARQLTGCSLDAPVDPPAAYSHCTHMLDLALLAASHAHDSQMTLFESLVSDAKEPFQLARLSLNDQVVMEWYLRETFIEPPSRQAGKDLRKMRNWDEELTRDERERAHLLRRAVFVSGGRGLDFTEIRTAAHFTASAGACYTFQPARSSNSLRMRGSARDFAGSGGPLGAPAESDRHGD